MVCDMGSTNTDSKELQRLRQKVKLSLALESWAKSSLGVTIVLFLLYGFVTQWGKINLNEIDYNQRLWLGILSLLILVGFTFFILFRLINRYVVKISKREIVYVFLTELIEKKSQYTVLPSKEYKSINSLIVNIHSVLGDIIVGLDNFSNVAIEQVRDELKTIRKLFSPNGAMSNLIFLLSSESFLLVKEDLIFISNEIKEGTYPNLISFPGKLEKKLTELPEYKKKIYIRESKIKKVLFPLYKTVVSGLGNKEGIKNLSQLITAYGSLFTQLILLFGTASIIWHLKLDEIDKPGFLIMLINAISVPLVIYVLAILFKTLILKVEKLSEE